MPTKKFLLVIVFLISQESALAVPPPDFIINIGSQIAGVFSFIAALLLAVFTISFQFLKNIFHIHKKKLLIFGLLTILVLALGGAYLYKQNRQEALNSEWQEPIPEPELPEPTPPDGPTSISNTDFQKLENPFVLDAREDIEFEYGRFPGATHQRFADLKAGKWQDLPKDQPIYVICWSGMRGQEVATFLREKGLNAIYLSEGADGWVASGGDWEGEIKFSAIYPNNKYGLQFNTSQTKAKIADGAILVDARENGTLGDYQIDLLSLESAAVEEKLAAVKPNSEIITVCDEYINCFMAKLVGVELEKRGHTFLGRYNEPQKWQ